MSENEFTRAPRAIAVVSTLQKLDLSKNRLDVLPTTYGKLANLVELDLRGNLLSVLPRELVFFFSSCLSQKINKKLIFLFFQKKKGKSCPKTFHS